MTATTTNTNNNKNSNSNGNNDILLSRLCSGSFSLLTDEGILSSLRPYCHGLRTARVWTIVVLSLRRDLVAAPSEELYAFPSASGTFSLDDPQTEHVVNGLI